MQDFGQWLPQSQITADLYFSSISMPPQLDTSIETQTRTSAVVPSVKESANLFVTHDGTELVEGMNNAAGLTEVIGNSAEPTECIDLNKTPARKPKRKKHRPKVLKDNKPSKTPKSATPIPSNEKVEKPSGKRKYVRKKTSSAGQPPLEETSSSHCRSELKPVRRSLDFGAEVLQESAQSGSQVLVAELSQSIPSTSQRDSQTHLACHVVSSTSSIHTSASQMVNTQLFPSVNMPNGVLLDLNNSTSQLQNHAKFVDSPALLSHSGIRETSGTNSLLEIYAGMSDRNVPDLNSSINLMPSMPTDFAQYLLSSSQASVRETQMANQMLNCQRIPETTITPSPCIESPAFKGHLDHIPHATEAFINGQMPHGYRLAQNSILPPKHIEGHSVTGNLNEFASTNDYLKLNGISQTGAAIGQRNIGDSMHIHAMDTRRECYASSGSRISLGVNLNQQNSGWAYVDAANTVSSQLTYFSEPHKRMRTDYLNNCPTGVVGHLSTSSTHLLNNENANVVSEINSKVFTLAEAQRLIAHEKSRASQRMISFRSSVNDMVNRPEMIQQCCRPTLCGSACRDSIEVPDKQFRLIAEEFTQLPSMPNNLQREKHIPQTGSCQLQSLKHDISKGTNLSRELHEHTTSPQAVTQSSFCVTPPDVLGRSTRGEHLRTPIAPTHTSTCKDTLKTLSCELENSRETISPPVNPIGTSSGNDVPRTGNHQVEVSEETFTAKLPEKRKVGRPRKELKSGEKPKPRGRPRKEKVVGGELASKGNHTNPLQNEDTCSYGPYAGEGSVGRAVNSDSVGESISEAIVPLLNSLDRIIQKIKVLDINKSEDPGITEAHGALVPYNGEFGPIIPFEGKVKRKRSRAKVDLDPVTALMWKLLMGPDMTDSAEGMDKDKEKWLDEERKIFQGRVDSFIARMHLVQGDRRFSPWKGSVVDSVVGVFLTQNVSDHLSSSAFMSLAAKFPVKPEASEKPAHDMSHTFSENGGCSGLFGNSVKLHSEILVEEASNTAGSLITTEDKEGSGSVELLGSSCGNGVDCAAGVYSNTYEKLPAGLHGTRPPAVRTGNGIEVDDGSLEDVVSSQNSAISSQNSPDYLFHMSDHMFLSTLLNFTAEEIGSRNMPKATSISTTYTELLRMQELKNKSNETIEMQNSGSVLNGIQYPSSKYQPLHSSVSYHQNGQVHLPEIHASVLEQSVYTGLNKVLDSNVTQTKYSYYRSPHPGTACKNETKRSDSLSSLLYGIDGSTKTPSPPEATPEYDVISPEIANHCEPLCSETLSFAKEQSSCEKYLSTNDIQAAFVKQHGTSNLHGDYTIVTEQNGGEHSQSGYSQQDDNVVFQSAKTSNLYSSNLCQNQKANSEVLQGVSSSLIDNSKDAKKNSPEVPINGSKAKKPRVGASKKRTYDWDTLRKEVLHSHGNKQRGQHAKDSIDWETIRQSDVKKISETIRERGMNNMLAERIKDFLNRLVRDHGSIDLEWLRYVDSDKAKDYLLSIRGLGLKSVECVRLLTLHHMAFPVDTNVGRICVRLGWVPLQPLPESLQLHLLEMYPMLENIQKYLWPRLCKLDQRTLYELHYQMITFGKVFCTKNKPNCNACPMRAECKHFASAFASARLTLPGPEEKSLVTSGVPIAAETCHQTYISSMPVGQLEYACHNDMNNRQPIIEEPASPEPEHETIEMKEDAIEDSFIDDPEEIPTIKLNFEEFTQNLKSYMQTNNIEIEDADMSKALVAMTPEVASIPTPKLKNVSRLRTEHQVYELPDSHPLLEGFDQREPDDPCPYLLSIWTPGETAQSTDAPKSFCNSQESGELCASDTCFSCNSIREVQAQKVRGTLLVPCRTAMRGSFPLNGTYFQVNEVFADHDTSRNPIDVPRSWIWDLPRRTVYFGTSIPTIFKGLTTEDIQHCFWRGFVCVRGFDKTSRAPRPLYARLHFPASKITRNKKSAGSAPRRDDE
ncbi:protein ROS1A-like [Oryza brachyantha]|uniref:HhH-GPD domain-containing protein n=1 Tax=Oryza brachyantha TaxID=4533 RepID=J3MVU3_ORYBR|nr:protein ROS1A-like [Oryza brachyantha]XP_040383774.1 protein ROS1A-like [Oryza brachyantha]